MSFLTFHIHIDRWRERGGERAINTCLTRGSRVWRGVSGEEMYWAMGAELAPAMSLITSSPK